MKKFFSLVLLAALLLSLCACGDNGSSAGTPNPSTTGTAGGSDAAFTVGYAKVNITPNYSVPLRGYGNASERFSNGFMDYIYATCAAITDVNGNTVLVYGLDQTLCFTSAYETIRPAISKATGVPIGNIMCSASHMHSGPDLDSTGLQNVAQYTNDLKNWLIEAAEKALEDRLPAKMYIAAVETEGLNFVRRYVLENGTYAGDNYGDFTSSPIAGHESDADPMLQLIKFTREGGKDVVMANFQTHPHRNGGSTNLSITADLVGVFRDTVEQALDCHTLYFTGASGNINPTSRISSENITANYKEQGQALAQYAIDANNAYTEVPTGEIKTVTYTYVGKVNHTLDYLVDDARKIAEVWSETHDFQTTTAMAREVGLNSPYHAQAIIAKANMGTTWEFDIYAFSIGNIGFAVAPYEMYDTNGVFIKENSPFEMTFILTCANSSRSYIPSQLGFDHGGYEVDQCRLVPGSGEELADLYVQLLESLHSSD